MADKSKYTARRARMVFGRDMKPCPNCAGYHIQFQTPIKMAEPILPTDTAKQLLGKWARAQNGMIGGGVLEGPVFIMCFDCGHKGLSMDCSGMTSAQASQSREVFQKVISLWNDGR